MTTKIPVELSSTPGIVDGSNATAITIDSSERVGIGTTSPSQKLETTGNIFINAPSGNPDLTIKTAGVGNNPFVAYRAGDNLVFDNMAVFSASTDYWRVAYGSSGSVTTELLAVTSAGNVGIGTVTPSQKLHVVGKIKCTDDLIIGGTSPRIDYDGGSTGSLRFFSTSANTERMRIESGGNVGIGTTSPASNLEVFDASGGAGTGVRINCNNGASDVWDLYSTTAGRLYVKNPNYSGGVYIQHGATSWTGNSDENLKENITSLGTVGDKLKNYRTSYFTWKDDNRETPPRQIGFIAQDWETDFPEVVNKVEGEPLGMQYTETIPILLKYIQELEARITTLEGE